MYASGRVRRFNSIATHSGGYLLTIEDFGDRKTMLFEESTMDGLRTVDAQVIKDNAVYIKAYNDDLAPLLQILHLWVAEGVINQFQYTYPSKNGVYIVLA